MCNDHQGEFMILFTESTDFSNSTSSTNTSNKDTVGFTSNLVQKSQSCLHAELIK
jgi:hypothetical protein